MPYTEILYQPIFKIQFKKCAVMMSFLSLGLFEKICEFSQMVDFREGLKMMVGKGLNNKSFDAHCSFNKNAYKFPYLP
jgi:hypothetical protein